jgi:hypothetical protein
MTKLGTYGDGIAVMQGKALLTVEYTPAGRGAGRTVLTVVDQETGDREDGLLRLDGWEHGMYQIIEWQECPALVVCGADQIVVVDLPKLRFGAAVGLEYEETETLEHPWVVEVTGRRRLIVATEVRVWCLDERLSIRWMWSARTQHEPRWVSGAPRMVPGYAQVPVRTLSRDIVVDLSVEDGTERPSP